VLTAATREAAEEVGVRIEEADLRCVHTVHVHGSGPEPRLGLFFEARRWVGEPTNREPDKCSTVRWFDLDDLPNEIIDYPAAGIRAYRDGVPFSVHGWSEQPALAPAMA
jgi:ADP-ribose pyrophosphatase YjhB (NUDIX family)